MNVHFKYLYSCQKSVALEFYQPNNNELLNQIKFRTWSTSYFIASMNLDEQASSAIYGLYDYIIFAQRPNLAM